MLNCYYYFVKIIILVINKFNSTVLQSTIFRAQTHQLGQLSVWPILPGDEGLYICEAGRILDDSGRTVFKRKFFAVTVSKCY